MKNVGSIIIGTKVDNKGLKDGLKDTKDLLEEFDDKNKIKPDINLDNDKILTQIQEIDKQIEELENRDKKDIELGDVKVTGFDTGENIQQINELTEKRNQLSDILTENNHKIAEEAIEVDKVNKELDKEIQKVNEIRDRAKERLSNMNYAEALELSGDEFEGWLKIKNIEIPESETTRLEEYLEKSINPELDVETNTLYEKLANVENEIIRYKTLLNNPDKLNLDDRDVVALIYKFNEATANANKLKNKIEQIDNTGLKSINRQMGELNKGMSSITKKVARWALAVFGVRSAYMFVRQAMSTLSEYNTDLADRLSNIRLVLATALEPIINRILNLVVTLLSYLNYLTTAWFGLNIFARASELSSKKMADNLASGASSAKEIRKQLAGFDEMNVLGDNVASAGGGGGSSKIPNFDLEQVAVPDWLKWIADNGDLVRLILEGIATALLMIKWNLSFIQGLGLFLVIDGIVSLIKDIKTYLEDKTWNNFKNILADISEILLGLGLMGLANGVETLSGKLGLVSIVLSQIIDGAKGIPDWINSVITFLKDPTWDNYVRTIRNSADASGLLGKMFGFVADKLGILQPQIKTTEEATRDLKTAQDNLTTAQDLYIDSIDRAEDAQTRLREILEKNQISNEQLNEIVRKGDEDYKNLNKTEKEVYKAYVNNEKAQKNVKESTKKLEDAKKNETVASLENELATLKETKQYDKYREAVVKAMNDGTIKADEARDLIGRSLSTMGDDAKRTFLNELPNSIKDGLDPKRYESFGSKLRNWFSSLWSGIWNGISGLLTFRGSGGGGGSSFAKGGIINPPRLATGAVINRPGRGVPVGGAIAGERGAEAIVPLTDSQQMELLGKTIGKYININLTNINQMNGRVLSRELKKLENESDFAFNR